MKTQFWGASVEVTPLGLSHVQLNKYNEEYVVSRPSSTCHNIIFGQMYIEHSGLLHCEKIIEGNVSIPEEKRLTIELEFKK